MDLFAAGRLAESRQLAEAAGIEIDWEARARHVQDIERELIVPAYGYRDLREYHDDHSCDWRLPLVRTPLLCVANLEDPLVSKDIVDVPIRAASINENVIAAVTKHGGHVGWISSLREEAWYVRAMFEYFEATRSSPGNVDSVTPSIERSD